MTLTESDIDWLRFNCTEDLVEKILKYEVDAEKLKRIEESGGKLMDKYCYKTAKSDREIVEHMKNFFNADNVLTKSEYKQKIIGEEK